MNRTDQIVDKFVINHNNNGGNIMAFEGINWIAPILNKLQAKYPPSFLSLVTRYVFDSFDINKVRLFANRGDNSRNDFSLAIFKDNLIFQTTVSNGFIQFAKPSDGSYDPICFDIRKRNKTGECQIVRLDHEMILQHDQVKVIEIFAESFTQVLEN
jgi:hypothetical protein